MLDIFELPDAPPAIHREHESLYQHSYRIGSINHTKNDYRHEEPSREPSSNHEKAIAIQRTAQIPIGDGITEMRMTYASYFELMLDLTGKRPEQAGLMFGPTNEESLVTHYVPENEGVGTSVTFTIDGDFVNRQIRRFKAVDIELKGIVHSHPPYFNRLSDGDLRYLRQLLGKPQNREAQVVFMPIVCSNRFIPFLVDSSINVSRPRFELV